jgi:hypothetical protein
VQLRIPFCQRYWNWYYALSTFELMKALINQFGGLGSQCSNCEALGSDVVSGDRSGSRLDIAKFFLCGSKWGGKLAAIVLERGEFSLGGWRHDVFDDSRQGESSAIVEVFVIAIGEVEMTGCSTFATGFGKV